MITKHSPKPYLFLLAVILLLMSIPKSTSESLRGFAAATLTPVWNLFTGSKSSSQAHYVQDPVFQKLQLENRLLHSEVLRLQELLQQSSSLSNQLKTLAPDAAQARSLNPSLQRHHELLSKRLSFQLQGVPAQVIFRSPSSWNSSLWLNVGMVDNERLSFETIAKNSPVLFGSSIVGVVDYVGKHQSRVRLITDSGLNPSVRAVRGDFHKRMVAEQMALLINRFSCCHGLFTNQEEKELMIKQLRILQKRLYQDDGQGTWYLAKGELHGGSQPLWRSPGDVLHGVGFNYDFPDEEGPARDLRTGMPVNGPSDDKAMPILRVNDLLITTGMDGVFPAGFYVAEVTKIHVLKEGDYSYEFEARPTAGDMQELTTVYVIPPLRKEEDGTS